MGHRRIGPCRPSHLLDTTPMDRFLDSAIKAYMRFRPRTRNRRLGMSHSSLVGRESGLRWR